MPAGEYVNIYDKNHNILSKELSIAFSDKVAMVEFMKEKYKCKYDNDICTAVVEYLYALYKYNESKE